MPLFAAGGIGTQSPFGESGAPEALLEKYGLTAAKVAAAARAVASAKKK